MILPILALALGIGLAALGPGPTPVPRMTLKNGTVYLLREPPRISAGRITFTTLDGRVYSLAESDVDSIGFVPTPTPAPRVTYSSQDSRALGAIAREQREQRGVGAAVAPASAATPRASKPARRVRPTRTPRPAPSRTPAPAAGTKSPG